MSDVLARICAEKRSYVAERKSAVPLSVLEKRVRAMLPTRGFRAALTQKAANEGFALICEIKRASPSKGLIRSDFNPPHLARAYAAGGAACLSVLTDWPYFQGQNDDLVAARNACKLPVLRKDFMLEPYQIVESRALGADCVLLIMAALEDREAAELEALALGLGMDVLVEVHDRSELERALALQSLLLGINNRNLKTLKVDLSTTEELASEVPDDRLLVAESGLFATADLLRLKAAGASCFLVGESLMRQDDVAAATAALLGRADVGAKRAR